MEDRRFQKSPCAKCGDPTYHLCYVGRKLVCVDCFSAACERATEKQKRQEQRKAEFLRRVKKAAEWLSTPEAL